MNRSSDICDESRVEEFLNPISRVVDIAVASYKARGFEHLSVAFGCTGGQHRSVYCAEWLAHRLRRAGETVTITHGSPAMAGVNAVRDMSDHAV